jgi:hypothetical protein
MSLFRCEECGCVENTACSNYASAWSREERKLCSECDPKIGKWHGMFEKRLATNLLIGENGFLYSEPPRHSPIIGKIDEKGIVTYDKK